MVDAALAPRSASNLAKKFSIGAGPYLPDFLVFALYAGFWGLYASAFFG